MPSSAEEDDVVVVSSDTEATPAKKKPRGRKKNVDGDEAAVPASNEKWWAKKMDVLEEPDTSDEDLDVVRVPICRPVSRSNMLAAIAQPLLIPIRSPHSTSVIDSDTIPVLNLCH